MRESTISFSRGNKSYCPGPSVIRLTRVSKPPPNKPPMKCDIVLSFATSLHIFYYVVKILFSGRNRPISTTLKGMKRIFFLLFLSALLLAADKDLVTERDYYLQVDAAYAATWRAKPSTDRAMFFLAQNGVSTGTAMSESGVLGSSFASGLRLTATILPTFQNELQGRFLGLLQWSGHSEVYNASQLIHVPLTPHYSLQWAEANDVYARDNLLFNSFDIAWIYQATPKRRDYFSFGLNLGPRYIQLRDTMRSE